MVLASFRSQGNYLTENPWLRHALRIRAMDKPPGSSARPRDGTYEP